MTAVRFTCERACYTVDELRQLLGLGRSAVYKLLADGTIPNIRAGRKFVVPKAAVARMLESVSCRPDPRMETLTSDRIFGAAARPREIA